MFVMRIALILILFTTMACAETPHTIIVISIDALHPAAISKAHTPTIDRVMSQNTFTLEGRSTATPKTLVAHAAMMTGITPADGGRVDNSWSPGEPVENNPTIFDAAKRYGFETAYIYAKEKLGYLAVAGIDHVEYDRDLPVSTARRIIKGAKGRIFVFLHISGLDEVGPTDGWLSPVYLEELELIDEDIAPLMADIRSRGSYAAIILSDHAGHDRLHGTHHPEDRRLPLLIDAPGRDTGIRPGHEWNVVRLPILLDQLFTD